MNLSKIKIPKKKKGSIIDIIIFVIMAFVITVFFGIYYYGHGLVTATLTNITSPIGTQGDTVGSISEDVFGNVHEGLGVLRILTFTLIFGMILSILVSNFLIKVHPVFFIPYFMFVVLAVMLSAYISNIYETFLTDPSFGGTLQTFTASTFILLYLPIWTTIVGFLGMIILMVGFLKDREIQGGIA